MSSPDWAVVRCDCGALITDDDRRWGLCGECNEDELPLRAVRGTRYVYVGGTFDLFHSGHVNLLRRAADYGSVVVALNDDSFAKRYKRKPIMNLSERMEVVGACKYVTEVAVNMGAEDSKPSILRWKPKYIVHGDDWQGEQLFRQLCVTQEFLDKHGIEMLYLPYTGGVSTSGVIERCHSRR